jgi:hypothetical protein
MEVNCNKSQFGKIPLRMQLFSGNLKNNQVNAYSNRLRNTVEALLKVYWYMAKLTSESFSRLHNGVLYPTDRSKRIVAPKNPLSCFRFGLVYLYGCNGLQLESQMLQCHITEHLLLPLVMLHCTMLAEDTVNVAAYLVALTTDLYSVPTPDSFIPQQAVKRTKQALHSILFSLCLFSASWRCIPWTVLQPLNWLCILGDISYCTTDTLSPY